MLQSAEQNCLVEIAPHGVSLGDCVLVFDNVREHYNATQAGYTRVPLTPRPESIDGSFTPCPEHAKPRKTPVHM